MQAARGKGNTMRDTRTRRGVERAARKATSTARASRALDGLLDLVALPVRGSELHAVSTGYSGGRVARNAIARVTPDDVTCYVALPFDERLIGGWRRKGRAAPELMEAPPSEAESERQAARAEPSTTCPRLVFRSRASSAGIIGGRRSGRRRSGRLPERKRSSCARRSALAEAAHARGDRLRDQDGSDDLGMANRKVDYREPSAGSDGIMTNAARKSLMLVKGASRRRP